MKMISRKICHMMHRLRVEIESDTHCTTGNFFMTNSAEVRVIDSTVINLWEMPEFNFLILQEYAIHEIEEMA